MTTAYVLLDVEPGFDEEVLRQIRSMDGVMEVYMVFGNYDIIVRIADSSPDKIRGQIEDRIRKIKRIRHTYTMLVMD